MALTVYSPGKKFPSVSITGGGCGLSCKHCDGHYLGAMKPATSPAALFSLAKKMKAEGANGFLLSGGCDVRGRVPIEDFIPALGNIIAELGLLVNVHCGFADERTAKMLKDAGVHSVSVDIVGSDRVAREVFGVESRASDYLKSYRVLRGAGLYTVPHITIGLMGWENSAEEEAIESLAREPPQRLVLNLLIPTKGTAYEGTKVDRERALAIFSVARRALPGTSIILGCMRPKGDPELERKLIGTGIDGIVNPSRAIVQELKTKCPLKTVELCCSIPAPSP